MRQLQLSIQSPELTLSSASNHHSLASLSAQAGISEIILATDSALQPMYLLPILSQMSLDKRWLMWVADEPSISRNWLSSLGVDASEILHITSEQNCLLEVCRKALAAGTGHLIIEWPGKISDHELEELENAAKQGNSHALLVRRR
jgi:cell division inhibitor SulA